MTKAGKKTPREFRLEAQAVETRKQMRGFETGATRSSDDGKIDYWGFLSHRAAKLFGGYMLRHQTCEDGSKRESDNWKKGIPISSYQKSRSRHVRELEQMEEQGTDYNDGSIMGDAYDEALCALFFNVQGLMHERLKARGE